MATAVMSPISLILQVLSDQGIVGSGFQVYIYAAGTTTPQTTYTSDTLATANSNPIVMGSNGRFQNVAVWTTAGTILKMVLTDANNNVITGGTIDNIPNLGDLSSYTGTVAITGTLEVMGNVQLGESGANAITGYGTTAAGNVDMSPDTGTFTGTLTGMTATTTGTINFAKMGNLVLLHTEAAITGTSNTTAMTMTGVPAELQVGAGVLC